MFTSQELPVHKSIVYYKCWSYKYICLHCVLLFWNRQLSDGSLSLIIGQKRRSFSPSKCHCKVVTVTKASEAEPLSYWHLEPLPKRIKLSCFNEESKCNGKDSEVKRNKAKAIIAVTHLSPFLAWHEITCVVLLHAKKSGNSENQQKSKRLTLLCGDFLLSLVEIFTGKLSINLKDYNYPGKYIYIYYKKYIYPYEIKNETLYFFKIRLLLVFLYCIQYCLCVTIIVKFYIFVSKVPFLKILSLE